MNKVNLVITFLKFPPPIPHPQVLQYLYGNLFAPGELTSIYTAFANLASKGADDSSPQLAQDRDPDRDQPTLIRPVAVETRTRALRHLMERQRKKTPFAPPLAPLKHQTYHFTGVGMHWF